MAEPARRFDPVTDPKLSPAASTVGVVPPELDPRYQPANDPAAPVDNRVLVENRGAGSGVIIAAIVVVLAVVAYFMFSPGNAPTPTAPPAPATTAEPAMSPAATAPAAPATQAPAAPAPATPPAN